MHELKKAVENVAIDELQRANEKFPLFNSKHEGCAVIKEELEETREELEILEASVAILWNDARGKRNRGLSPGEHITRINDYVGRVYDQAVEVAAEAIQTAAMLLKYEMSLIEQEERTE